ncbi:MAG: glycosyltransferase [Bacteroidota bacterium]
MIILSLLLLPFTVGYFLFLHRIRRGIKSLVPAGDPSAPLPFVSILVAARNEEGTIQRCLHALLAQEYPPDFWEVIIVDDGSTDRTGERVRAIAKENPPVSLISLPNDDVGRIGRKPTALDQGIRKARGEVILTTDADCSMGRQWVRTMVSMVTGQSVFVAGPVLEKGGRSLFARLQQLEFLGLVTTTAGLIGSGRPIICNGANLAFKKSVYFAAGGFGEGNHSCDDEVMMQRILHRNLGKVDFAALPEAIVTTRPSERFSDFWRQRTRWASKHNHYENPSVLVRVISIYIFFVLLLLGIILAPFSPFMGTVALIVLSGKMLFEYITLRAGSQRFRVPLSIPEFFLAQIFHIPYIVLAGAAGQFRSVEWKGRAIRP